MKIALEMESVRETEPGKEMEDVLVMWAIREIDVIPVILLIMKYLEMKRKYCAHLVTFHVTKTVALDQVQKIAGLVRMVSS